MNPAHNRQIRDSHVNMLQRIQERLWDDFTWPHLRVKRLRAVAQGQRYYSPPSEFQIDNIEKIEVYNGGGWRKLAPGIFSEHYSAHDSDLDQRSYPPMRWAIHEDEDIEIWPISDQNGDPETNEGMFKFTGIRNLKPFVKDADRADLDDNLLVMFAAAELLAAQGAKDAQLKLDQANQIYRRQRGGLTPRRRFRMFGVDDIVKPREYVIFNVRSGAVSDTPGPTGAPGQRGSIWTTGAGPPSPDTASITGDMYLNETTGDVWRYDGAAGREARSDVAAGSQHQGASWCCQYRAWSAWSARTARTAWTSWR